MQRGILQVTQSEVTEIFKYFDLTPYKDYPLEIKLVAAKASQDELISIELSENEVEAILDSVAIPEESHSEATVSLRNKSRELITKFRDNLRTEIVPKMVPTADTPQ